MAGVDPSNLHTGKMDIGAVLLGAGFSRRFGADKRVYPLKGQTVAECTLEAYCQAFSQIRVVTRPDDAALNHVLERFNVEIIPASDAQLGMGHSLAAGFADLTWRWAFVGLLDMPFIKVTTLKLLVESASHNPEAKILRPCYRPTAEDKPTFGHPIGWHHKYFAEIRRCVGDQGARELLKTHQTEVENIVVDDVGIYKDIDTQADVSNQGR